MDLSAEYAYKTPLSHSPLLPFLLLSLMRQKHSPGSSEKIKKEYDYIVVGGGAAGSVVAGRLSEESCVSVLLLEAGPKPPLLSEMPGLSFFFVGTHDWNFKTVPQKNLAMNQEVNLYSGKMLGGSGNHNSMDYVRGNHQNYNDWAAQGARGWRYEDIFKYFLKLEDNKNLDSLDYGYHNMSGPITVEKPRFHSDLKIALLKAAEELGYKTGDSNGAQQTGFYDYQLNTRNGQRCSSVKGYLVPAEHRPNLDILLNATVTKVIIEDKQAKGVIYYLNGKLQTVRARKEVIVSGGAINTPKILMLSSIGPREELEKWNIPVIADLPVGKNLQDHGASFYSFTLNPQFTKSSNISDDSVVQNYIHQRSGPLSNPSTVAMAFLGSLNGSPTADFPRYQLYINDFPKELLKKLKWEPRNSGSNQKVFTCLSQMLQPRSRGTVTLRSPNPFDLPVIDPNYLEDPKDLDDIAAGLQMCKNIVNTQALQRLGAKPLDEVKPGCEDYTSSYEELFRCSAKRFFTSNYHLVGTAKMGDLRESSTVVDPELRVKGIKGLRVVDASVMPTVTSGNTNIPTIMIAEKASDLIRSSIKCF